MTYSRMNSLNILFVFFIVFISLISTSKTTTISVRVVTSSSFEIEIINGVGNKQYFRGGNVSVSHRYFESTITDEYQFKINFNRTILIFPCLKPQTQYSFHLKLDDGQEIQRNVSTLPETNQRNQNSNECSLNSRLFNFTLQFDNRNAIIFIKQSKYYVAWKVCGNQYYNFPTTCPFKNKKPVSLTFQSEDRQYLDMILMVRTPDEKTSIDNLTISSSTTNSINLSVNCNFHSSWKYLMINYSVADFIGRPQFLDTKSFTKEEMDPIKSHHVINNLHAGSKYNITVCAYNKDNSTCTSPISYWTEDKSPLLVDSFKIGSTGKTTVGLKWNSGVTMESEMWTGVVLEYLVVVDELRKCYLLSCKDCENYQLENLNKKINMKTYCDGMIKNKTLNVNEIEHNVTIHDLSPFTEYMFSLYSINRANISPVSRITGRTREDISGPVTNINFYNSTNTSFCVSWSPPIRPNGIIKGYVVQLMDSKDRRIHSLRDSQYKQNVNIRIKISIYKERECSSCNYKESSFPHRSVNINQCFNNLHSFGEYKIKIVAINSAGIGRSSIERTKTKEGISGPPSNVKCSGNPESVSIRWDRPRSPNGIITGYRIMLGSHFVSNNLTDSTRQYKIDDLQSCSLYTIKVHAVNRAGIGEAAVCESTTTAKKEIPPSNLRGKAIDTERILVKWNPIVTQCQVKYRVEVKEVNSDRIVCREYTDRSDYECMNLIRNRKYTFRAKSVVEYRGLNYEGDWSHWNKRYTLTHPEMYFKSCRDILAAGGDTSINDVYEIFPTHGPLMKVFCQNEWIVIQRRINGQESFARNWNEYKFGFGDLKKEFWIGNEYLHILTSIYNMKIRFELWDDYQNYEYAEYYTFKVDSEINEYKLTIKDYYGTAGDAMKDHNEYSFSTKDRDNDYTFISDCSQKYGGSGGWWFHKCSTANLNGEYRTPGRYYSDGVTWDKWRDGISLKRSVIKIAIKY